MVIGSGPIIIGQACEFDYSGTQACKALKEEGYSVVLVNSNPATIMTDPQMADKTYIEPLTVENMEKIDAMAELLGVTPEQLLAFLQTVQKEETQESDPLKNFYYNPDVFVKLHSIDSKGLRELVMPKVKRRA